MALNIVEKIDDAVNVKHVLASVSDKRGLDRLVPGLVAANPDVKIYSTGGTYAAIETLLGPDAAVDLAVLCVDQRETGGAPIGSAEQLSLELLCAVP